MTVHGVVLPGGGYSSHADHEAEPVAEWLAGLGVHSSVFRYPLGAPHPVAHDAVRRYVRDIRAAGAEKILLVGFSAGGHAAGLAALDPLPGGEVDGAVLIYPVVSMRRHPHQGTRRILLGDDVDDQRADRISLEQRVSLRTPPLFIAHALDDDKVSVEHAFALSSALRRHRRPHELVIFPTGGHGFGLGLAGSDQAWCPLAERWFALTTGEVDAHGQIAKQ